jgi:pimeloyl-ACP methyl ester carboxylesterase
MGDHTGDDSREVTRERRRVGGLSMIGLRPAREQGGALLFIHGLFAASWMFERWMRYFADRGRPAYAVDLRGHGESARVANVGGVTLADYVDDAATAARSLGRVVPVGHSMGGLLAQKLAESGAGEAVVLVSPAPPRGIPLLSLRLAAREAKYLPALLRSREVRVGRSDADAMILNRIPLADRDALFRRFEPDSGRAGRDIMLGAVAVDPRRVRRSMLVLAGDDDRFVPLRVARRVATRYGASLRVMPGRGHLMMQEPGWEEPAAAIDEWLREVGL